MRFDIRVNGVTVLCHDDAASVIFLLGKLATADEIDRVLLAAEGIKSERTEAGTWNPSPEWREFAASVRERLLILDLPELPDEPDLFVGASYKPGHSSDLAF